MYTSDDSYIAVRRSGTIAHQAAQQKVIKSFPPVEFLPPSELLNRNLEITQRLMIEYYVVDIVGYKDADSGCKINYNKSVGAKIFSSESSIELMNQIIEFSTEYKNYAKSRCIDLVNELKDYIKLACFELPTQEDRQDFYDFYGANEYEDKFKKPLSETAQDLGAWFFELCRDRVDTEYLKLSAIKSAAMQVNHNVDDSIYVLKSIDEFYISERAKKQKAELERQKASK